MAVQPAARDGALVTSTIRSGVVSPALPKDALGVTLLVACAAMALDILTPWSESFSVRQSLVSRFGHPAYLVVALALLAALPLYQPRFRRVPLCAAAPLVIGALAVGVGLTYYVFLARENAQALSQLAGSPPLLATQRYTATPISPQIGLYLFMLAGVVLVVVGYQFFLAAVRSQYVLVTLPQPPAYPMMTAQTVIATIPVNVPSGVPSPAPIHISPVAALTSSAVSTPPQAAAPLTTIPTPHADATPVPASAAPVPSPAAKIAGNGGLVLPGTEAWNQPPISPMFNKHTRMRGGRRYSSR